MLWSRKPAPVHDRTRAVGIDLTASRALAEAVGGKSRELLLDGAEAELPLFVACDWRVPEVGHAGLGLCRRAPHAGEVFKNPALANSYRAIAEKGRDAFYKGEIAECTTANIFIVKDGVALTPPLESGLLAGITREFLMEVAAETGHFTQSTLAAAGRLK